MKIEKGGISREIKENHLSEYLEKGYSVSNVPESTPKEREGINFEKMTVAELKAYADDIGTAVEDGLKKAEIIELLKSALGGEDNAGEA